MVLEISASGKYEAKDSTEVINRLIASLEAVRDNKTVTKLPKERFSFSVSADYYEED